MRSSIEEIFEPYIPFIQKGMVGIVQDLKEERMNKVTYNDMCALEEALTSEELWRLQPSENEIEARKSGCKTSDEIIEYCNGILSLKKEEAMKTGKPVICDTIGMFWCKDSHEECSWDMVYEVVTPNGDIRYIREHCY